jgi:hypothetical protein
MNTDKEIKALAAQITPHYCYGTPYYINTRTDKMRAQGQMPACLHIQTAEGSVSLQDGAYFSVVKNTRRVQVGFADAVKFDADPEKTLEKVEHLLGLGKSLIKLMNESGKWEQVDEISYQVLYDVQDGNLVWVLMDFRVRETAGECIDAL